MIGFLSLFVSALNMSKQTKQERTCDSSSSAGRCASKVGARHSGTVVGRLRRDICGSGSTSMAPRGAAA